MVSDEVVVIGRVVVAPYATKAVGTLHVIGGKQALCNHAPLYGDILALIYREGLVDAPTGRNMVQNNILVSASTDGIRVVAALIAQSHTYVADDDLVSPNVERMALDADAVARSRLPRYGDIGVAYGERTLQFDSARHTKHDGAGAFGLDGRTQASGTIIVEVGNLANDTAAASYSVFAVALCGRESQLLGYTVGA